MAKCRKIYARLQSISPFGSERSQVLRLKKRHRKTRNGQVVRCQYGFSSWKASPVETLSWTFPLSKETVTSR